MWKTELMKNGNFHLFAANKKWERQTSVCLLQTETGNGSLFSFIVKDRRKRRLLFQKTCPSMLLCIYGCEILMSDFIGRRSMLGQNSGSLLFCWLVLLAFFT
jgi:hypothetical protein